MNARQQRKLARALAIIAFVDLGIERFREWRRFRRLIRDNPQSFLHD